MAITKVRGWVVDAEVLGMMRSARWEETAAGTGTLVIEGLRMDDAMSVLNRLSLGQLVAVEPRVPDELQKQDKAAKAKLEGVMPNGAPAPSAAGSGAGTSAPEPEVTKTRKRSTQVVEEPALEEKGMDLSGKGSDHDDDPIEGPAETAGAVGYDLEILKQASTIRGIITHLMEHGHRDAASVIAICKRIKADVPVLNRVANLDARIEKAMEILVEA